LPAGSDDREHARWDGHKEAAQRVGLSRSAAYEWHNRYEEEGLAGLRDRPRPGRASRVDAATAARLKERIVAGAEQFGPEWVAIGMVQIAVFDQHRPDEDGTERRHQRRPLRFSTAKSVLCSGGSKQPCRVNVGETSSHVRGAPRFTFGSRVPIGSQSMPGRRSAWRGRVRFLVSRRDPAEIGDPVVVGARQRERHIGVANQEEASATRSGIRAPGRSPSLVAILSTALGSKFGDVIGGR
jgi:hypothetical protein